MFWRPGSEATATPWSAGLHLMTLAKHPYTLCKAVLSAFSFSQGATDSPEKRKKLATEQATVKLSTTEKTDEFQTAGGKQLQ